MSEAVAAQLTGPNGSAKSTSRSKSMTSSARRKSDLRQANSQASAKRNKKRPEPISTDRSQAEGIAGFASRGMELQTVTLRYKRGPRQECIRHDDVYAVSLSKTTR